MPSHAGRAIETEPETAHTWKTVRCENERCRHIVFRYVRDAIISGAIVIEVKCSCNTLNRIRVVAQGVLTTN